MLFRSTKSVDAQPSAEALASSSDSTATSGAVAKSGSLAQLASARSLVTTDNTQKSSHMAIPALSTTASTISLQKQGSVTVLTHQAMPPEVLKTSAKSTFGGAVSLPTDGITVQPVWRKLHADASDVEYYISRNVKEHEKVTPEESKDNSKETADDKEDPNAPHFVRENVVLDTVTLPAAAKLAFPVSQVSHTSLVRFHLVRFASIMSSHEYFGDSLVIYSFLSNCGLCALSAMSSSSSLLLSFS